jgi:cell division protein FtsL
MEKPNDIMAPNVNQSFLGTSNRLKMCICSQLKMAEYGCNSEMFHVVMRFIRYNIVNTDIYETLTNTIKFFKYQQLVLTITVFNCKLLLVYISKKKKKTLHARGQVSKHKDNIRINFPTSVVQIRTESAARITIPLTNGTLCST